MCPTYDYQHTYAILDDEDCSLGQEFEKFEPITAEPLSKCPNCGGPIKRLIGAGAGLIFKGSGFYCTDYKGTKQDKPATETKPSEHKTADPATAKEPKIYTK